MTLKKCVQSKADYAALLRNNSLLTSSVFEDPSDTFNWVFRNYQPNTACDSSSANTAQTLKGVSTTAFGQFDSFLPPASSLGHLSDDELNELTILLNNATIEHTANPHYLEGVTEKLLTELTKMSASIGQIGTLKELLTIICQGLTAFEPYRSQSVIYDRLLFAVAFSKLTEKQRRHYTANYARDSLQLLNQFARHEIITYYSARKRQVLIRAKNADKAGPESWQKLKNQQQQQKRHHLCGYCHEGVHSFKYCPILKNILCFQCFHYGHSSKRCPQAGGDVPLKMIAY